MQAVEAHTDFTGATGRGAKSVVGHTPSLALGPYYPLNPGRSGSECLWSPCPEAGDSAHRVVEISGRVLNVSGSSVAGALIEVWQADARGQYRHQSARVKTPLDDAFAGYASQRTDTLGRYLFRTCKPAAYVEGGVTRAPHVHFQVTASQDRLITQMFFPNEALNASDRLLAAALQPQRLIAAMSHVTPELLRLHWDIVLLTG